MKDLFVDSWVETRRGQAPRRDASHNEQLTGAWHLCLDLLAVMAPLVVEDPIKSAARLDLPVRGQAT